MKFKDMLESIEVDYNSLVGRFCNNEVLVEKYMMKFPEDDSFKCMQVAVTSGDLKAVMHYAHTLKGISANLGLNNLSDSCSQIVQALRNDKIDELKKLNDNITVEYQKVICAITAFKV